MGLIGGIKTKASIVKDSIGSAKASSKLDSLAERAVAEFGDLLTLDDRDQHAHYLSLKKRQEKLKNPDEANALTDEIEDTKLTLLLSVATNAKLPKKLRDEVVAGIEAFRKANGLDTGAFAERLRGLATAEREFALIERLVGEETDEGA